MKELLFVLVTCLSPKGERIPDEQCLLAGVNACKAANRSELSQFDALTYEGNLVKPNSRIYAYRLICTQADGELKHPKGDVI